MATPAASYRNLQPKLTLEVSAEQNSKPRLTAAQVAHDLDKAQLGPEKDVPVYMLDFRAMPIGQRARLFGLIAAENRVPVYEVERTAANEGFPIREADVIVSYDMRAFV